MSRHKEKSVSRSSLNFGVFKDLETDWVFKRTLSYMCEKAAEIGECLSVAALINESSWESWVIEWAERAQKVEELGNESLTRNSLVSARECFLRASNYYRTAEYGARPSDPRFHEWWEKSRSCFQQAGRLFNPPIEMVGIPFEGKKLPGYFWRPVNDSQDRPTLVGIGGNDSTLEELMYGMGAGAVCRGYNFFTFDHPGHRGAVHLYPDCVKRHDYEVPYGAALDCLEKYSGVDDRIALTGLSFGGFAAVRVAAYDGRVKAVIPNNPILDPLEPLMYGLRGVVRRIPLSLLGRLLERKLNKSPLRKSWFEYSMWTRGERGLTYMEDLKKSAGPLQKGESFWDALRRSNKFVITKDELQKITCPALALVGEDEGEVPIMQARRFIDGISSTRKELHIFTLERDGSNDHCQMGNVSRLCQVMFDWMDKIFEI